MLRRQGADILIGLVTGIVTNLLTDALERRRDVKPRTQNQHTV